MTTNTDINELARQLRDAALKATKGLWYRAMMRFNGITTNEITSVLFHGEAEAIIASTVEKRDAEFIALANPINIQLILDALEAAQKRIEKADIEISQWVSVAEAAGQDDIAWHKLADRDSELICKLADSMLKIIERAEKAEKRVSELEASQPVAPEYIGLSVSVGVSTSEENAGHRYFGRVSSAQASDNVKDKNGVVLLVQDDVEANFNELIAPDGWKLVPIEPTPEMIAAGDECWMMTESCADWAMLNAAPVLQEGK